MKVFTITKIGAFHTDHNEDAIALGDLGSDKMLFAVMDGCSMGMESHFASTLIAKMLRKIAKQIHYRDFVEKSDRSIDWFLKEILAQLFHELKILKNQLLLETEELLSTLILGILDRSQKKAVLIVIGDGLVCCNGVCVEFEQGDKPDYLGYHLGEDFEKWYAKQTQKLSFEQVADLGIATDGIFSFQPFDTKTYDPIHAAALVDFLLVDRQYEAQETMLHKKILEIETEYGLRPSDDLTVLRIIELP